MKKLSVLLIMAWTGLGLPNAFGGLVRSIDADQIQSSDHTKTFTLPSSTGTLASSSSVPVAIQETPTGTCNGSLTSLTLSTTPFSNASVSLMMDGILLFQGSGLDYTISGSTITLLSACSTGQRLYAVYAH